METQAIVLREFFAAAASGSRLPRSLIISTQFVI
jgi:hypothetical protein